MSNQGKGQAKKAAEVWVDEDGRPLGCRMLHTHATVADARATVKREKVEAAEARVEEARRRGKS